MKPMDLDDPVVSEHDGYRIVRGVSTPSADVLFCVDSADGAVLGEAVVSVDTGAITVRARRGMTAEQCAALASAAA